MTIVLIGISLLIRSTGSLPEKVKAIRIKKAIYVLTVVATIVRLEVALFLLPIVLSLVIQRRISFRQALVSGIIGGVGALCKYSFRFMKSFQPSFSDNWA